MSYLRRWHINCFQLNKTIAFLVYVYRAAAVLLESQREAEKLKKAEAEAKAAAAAALSVAAESSAVLDDSGGSGGPKSPDSHIEINDNYDSTQVGVLCLHYLPGVSVSIISLCSFSPESPAA